MFDWATAASLATAGGTLVLAGATFAAVRSANRSSRATERALLVGIRPVLMPSKLEDPPEKIGFIDNHWIKVDGGRAVAEVVDDVIYLGISLRNAGSGLAVLDRWDLHVDRPTEHSVPDSARFRRLTRDIYVPGGDRGFWQGALRDREDPAFGQIRTAIEERRTLTIDLLYGDHEGGQRTISRFTVVPAAEGAWLAAVGRHWNLDRPDPR